MKVRDRITFDGKLIEREVISNESADVTNLIGLVMKGMKNENNEN